jgi:hypothetical protein
MARTLSRHLATTPRILPPQQLTVVPPSLLTSTDEPTPRRLGAPGDLDIVVA